MDGRSVPRAGLRRVVRRHARVHVADLSVQLPKLHHASQRLRLRRTERPVYAAEAPGSAGRLRPRAVRLRALVGPRARWREGAGFVLDVHAPLFLYGYGSYGIGTPPTFSSNRLILLDRGMAYAIAHIRGGNEMRSEERRVGKEGRDRRWPH